MGDWHCYSFDSYDQKIVIKARLAEWDKRIEHLKNSKKVKVLDNSISEIGEIINLYKRNTLYLAVWMVVVKFPHLDDNSYFFDPEKLIAVEDNEIITKQTSKNKIGTLLVNDKGIGICVCDMCKKFIFVDQEYVFIADTMERNCLSCYAALKENKTNE